MPAVVNRNGVREILEMELSEEERSQFKKSCEVIKEMINEIGL